MELICPKTSLALQFLRISFVHLEGTRLRVSSTKMRQGITYDRYNLKIFHIKQKNWLSLPTFHLILENIHFFSKLDWIWEISLQNQTAHQVVWGFAEGGRVQGIRLQTHWVGWLGKRRPRASQLHSPLHGTLRTSSSASCSKRCLGSQIFISPAVPWGHVLASWTLSAVLPLLPLCMALERLQSPQQVILMRFWCYSRGNFNANCAKGHEKQRPK